MKSPEARSAAQLAQDCRDRVAATPPSPIRDITLLLAKSYEALALSIENTHAAMAQLEAVCMERDLLKEQLRRVK